MEILGQIFFWILFGLFVLGLLWAANMMARLIIDGKYLKENNQLLKKILATLEKDRDPSAGSRPDRKGE